MEEREEDPHERLNQQFSELEKEWAAMKTGKGSCPVSCITVEEALEFVENTPRKLMLSLQHDQDCPEEEMIQMRSPCRRKLFHDSDDETEATWFSHSTCWSSNEMGVRDDNNKIKEKENENEKKRGMNIVYVSVVFILLLFLAVVMDGFDHHSRNRQQINTLVPT